MSEPVDKRYAIHPAVGIARLGNADVDPTKPESFYLGAESPYQVPNENGSYKRDGRIKKQAQRFRIYEYQDGTPVREITLAAPDVAAIEWTVHLANRKAALDPSKTPGSESLPSAVPPKPWGLNATPPPDAHADLHYWPANIRNKDVSDRDQLVIDAGPRSVCGDGQRVSLGGTVTFKGATKAVSLGTLTTENDTGRLLVFAADGLSEGLDDNGEYSPLPKLSDWGNNDDWYDDTADGWVRAKVTFADGTVAVLDEPDQRAWVICAAPRYAPAIGWFTTLYDTAVNALGTAVPDKPSFARHIYPILRCASLLPWLSVRAAAGHSRGGPGNYMLPGMMKLLMDTDPAPDSDSYKLRNSIFQRLRDPNAEYVDRETVQHFMPQVSKDITRNKTGDYDVAVLTPFQYAICRKWRDGDFLADAIPSYVPLEQLDIAAQPSALDQAAVEGSAGTPFYPGIESWRILRARELYADSPLRFSDSTRPGDLTMGNALPWQADFLDCNDAWWPVQRPNQVTRDNQPLQPWVPPSWMPTEDEADYNAMVAGWWRLGFVVSDRNGERYIEVDGDADADHTA